MDCTLPPLARTDAGTTLKVTSGGIESGAEPIFDRHGEVVAKLRKGAGAWNAGNRKVGIVSEDSIDADAAR